MTTTSNPTPPTEASPTDAVTIDSVDAARVEAHQWRSRAREFEREAKAARDDLARIRTEYAHRLVDAEFRAAADGRDRDVVEAVLEALDRTAYVDNAGNVDAERIARTLDAIAPRTTTTPTNHAAIVRIDLPRNPAAA